MADEEKLFATSGSGQQVTEPEMAHWKAFKTIQAGNIEKNQEPRKPRVKMTAAREPISISDED